MKQTAVEWLFNELCSEKLSWNKDTNGKLFFDKITSDILQQAKEMEKEQIIAFGKKCYHPLSERKYTSDTHFECTICGDNNY
jgi:hypothetical protein